MLCSQKSGHILITMVNFTQKVVKRPRKLALGWLQVFEVFFSMSPEMWPTCAQYSHYRDGRSMTTPCTLCLCKGGNQAGSWLDFRFQADWQDHMLLAKAWLHWDKKSNNSIFTAKGLTGISVGYDYMHCKHLGTDLVQY